MCLPVIFVATCSLCRQSAGIAHASSKKMRKPPFVAKTERRAPWSFPGSDKTGANRCKLVGLKSPRSWLPGSSTATLAVEWSLLSIARPARGGVPVENCTAPRDRRRPPNETPPPAPPLPRPSGTFRLCGDEMQIERFSSSMLVRPQYRQSWVVRSLRSHNQHKIEGRDTPLERHRAEFDKAP